MTRVCSPMADAQGPLLTLGYIREALRDWPDTTELLVISRTSEEIRMTAEHSVSEDEDGEFVQLFEVEGG